MPYPNDHSNAIVPAFSDTISHYASQLYAKWVVWTASLAISISRLLGWNAPEEGIVQETSWYWTQVTFLAKDFYALLLSLVSGYDQEDACDDEVVEIVPKVVQSPVMPPERHSSLRSRRKKRVEHQNFEESPDGKFDGRRESSEYATPMDESEQEAFDNKREEVAKDTITQSVDETPAPIPQVYQDRQHEGVLSGIKSHPDHVRAEVQDVVDSWITRAEKDSTFKTRGAESSKSHLYEKAQEHHAPLPKSFEPNLESRQTSLPVSNEEYKTAPSSNWYEGIFQPLDHVMESQEVQLEEPTKNQVVESQKPQVHEEFSAVDALPHKEPITTLPTSNNREITPPSHAVGSPPIPPSREHDTATGRNATSNEQAKADDNEILTRYFKVPPAPRNPPAFMVPPTPQRTPNKDSTRWESKQETPAHTAHSQSQSQAYRGLQDEFQPIHTPRQHDMPSPPHRQNSMSHKPSAIPLPSPSAQQGTSVPKLQRTWSLNRFAKKHQRSSTARLPVHYQRHVERVGPPNSMSATATFTSPTSSIPVASKRVVPPAVPEQDEGDTQSVKSVGSKRSGQLKRMLSRFQRPKKSNPANAGPAY